MTALREASALLDRDVEKRSVLNSMQQEDLGRVRKHIAELAKNSAALRERIISAAEKMVRLLRP